MSDDPLKALAEAADKDRQARLDSLLDANARAIRRGRRLRWALRAVILLFGGVGLLAAYGFVETDWGALAAVACLSFFAVVTAAVVLFFMGGLLPARMSSQRLLLSDREREMLDN